MSDHLDEHNASLDVSTEAAARTLLDGLIEESRLYKSSQDYRDLLDFVVRLRKFAPFNAMLLQVQKPGLLYAESKRNWFEEFGRWPREGARPLLILWPFGPVALVYDVVDTEGDTLPADVFSFIAKGPMTRDSMCAFAQRLAGHEIIVSWIDSGDARAGYIRVASGPSPDDATGATTYAVRINRNHPPAVQFTTLAHELGHLYLGHLGADRKRGIPQRPRLGRNQLELEAESVAYIVCRRNGITAKSQTYLSGFVGSETSLDHADVYQVMRAAGQVEFALGLADRISLGKPQ